MEDAQRALPERMSRSASNSNLVDEQATHKLEAKAQGKPEGTGKKTKLVRVHPMYIRALEVINSRRQNRKPYPVIPDEILEGLNPEMQAAVRDNTAAITSSFEKKLEEDKAILNQYYAKGYAEMEITDDEGMITDDEDEEGYDYY